VQAGAAARARDAAGALLGAHAGVLRTEPVSLFFYSFTVTLSVGRQIKGERVNAGVLRAKPVSLLLLLLLQRTLFHGELQGGGAGNSEMEHMLIMHLLAVFC
jgi:hypothetical protein